MAEKGQKIYTFLDKYFHAFLGSVYVLTLGLIQGKNRTRLAKIASEFGWKDPRRSEPTRIPIIDPMQYFLGDDPVYMRDPISDDGNVSLLELLVINTLIKRKNPVTLFEVGTFDGRTALNMAANTSPDAKIYTLDLPSEKIVEARQNPLGDAKFVGKALIGYKFKNSSYGKKITQLEGDSATFNFKPYEKSMDFIFVDGAHSYSYVSSDTTHSLDMLREGGVVIWHDYVHICRGVTVFLNELYATGGIFKKLRWVRGTTLVILASDHILKNNS